MNETVYKESNSRMTAILKGLPDIVNNSYQSYMNQFSRILGVHKLSISSTTNSKPGKVSFQDQEKEKTKPKADKPAEKHRGRKPSEPPVADCVEHTTPQGTTFVTPISAQGIDFFVRKIAESEELNLEENASLKSLFQAVANLTCEYTLLF